ncbi:MAG: phosphohydrolase, partial [Leptolyngbya sp. RL_3_1]|nr:phosphohydrolase [Leptolyngbya sp. RL_3_1]
MGAIAVATLTSVVGHRFYNEPQLTIGRPAPETIRAPQSTQAVDQVATDAAIEAALKNALSIYRVDQTVSQAITANLKQSLFSITQLRQAAGPFPFIPTTLLSAPTQANLRQMSGADWQRLLQALATPPKNLPGLQGGSTQQALAELRRYQQQPQTATPWPELI